jgi:hypothetical protein
MDLLKDGKWAPFTCCLFGVINSYLVQIRHVKGKDEQGKTHIFIISPHVESRARAMICCCC